ncbi:hypothetical protein BBJ28_00017875 [Nothophytophthora sp. Chile5]|nr:hypothetical protein BBJ28_00017875 [Nothophytophthora sp. Chile5]
MLGLKAQNVAGDQGISDGAFSASNTKQRATVVLLAASDGNKYATFIVSNTKDSMVDGLQIENDARRLGFGNNLWTESTDIQNATGAQIYGNPTAWWNQDITVAWMEYFFGDRTGASEPVLLLLDSFSGHWTDNVMGPPLHTCAERLNIKLKAVSPKLTWRSQPAHVARMKPFKDGLRRKWVDHPRGQLERRRGGNQKLLMVPPNRDDVAEWVMEGWLRLSDQIIISGFAKCGFRDPLQHAAEPDDEVYDTASLINDLREVGFVDRSVREIRTSMDVLDSTADEIDSITEIAV